MDKSLAEALAEALAGALAATLTERRYIGGDEKNATWDRRGWS